MKIFTGKVIAKKMQKTASVAVSRDVQHPLYGKRIKRTKKYPVHDELDSKVGDVVRFVASKPYSKTKKWKLIEIVGEKVKPTKTVAKKETKKAPVKKTVKKVTKK